MSAPSGSRVLKVLLVDDTPDRASALKQALSAVEGVAVACTLDSPFELLARVAEHALRQLGIPADDPDRSLRLRGCGLHLA